MSKEEILQNQFEEFIKDFDNPNSIPFVSRAMDIYAEQQSIAFAEWTEREDYTLVFETNLWGKLGSRQNYTTSQLYKLFLKNKTND